MAIRCTADISGLHYHSMTSIGFPIWPKKHFRNILCTAGIRRFVARSPLFRIPLFVFRKPLVLLRLSKLILSSNHAPCQSVDRSSLNLLASISFVVIALQYYRFFKGVCFSLQNDPSTPLLALVFTE